MSDPNALVLQVKAGTLQQGFCPTDYQDLLNTFSANQTVTFPNTFAGVTVSATKPTDTAQAWLQLDSLGRPVRLYYFAQGAWLSLHPEVPGMTKIWTTAIPDFTTFDGGDANTLSAISGPMWEIVLSQVFPLGAGTLPSGKVIAVGDVGGEENHTLLTKEMPSHNHSYGMDPQTGVAANYISNGTALRFADPANAATENFLTVGFNTATKTGQAGGDTTAGHPTVGHNTMPPYQVVAFLRRTNRLFYAVN